MKMGVFSTIFPVAAIENPGREISVKGIVDTGATLNQIPFPLAKQLGIQRTGSIRVYLADGSMMTLPLGNIWVRHARKRVTVPVMISKPGSPALWGAILLEALGLKVDPKNRRLVPGLTIQAVCAAT